MTSRSRMSDWVSKIYAETWKALIEQKKLGKVRNIGVSNFLIPHLEHLMKNSDVKPVYFLPR
jgi:diketogulonate reductase-like aldo/keto reductase